MKTRISKDELLHILALLRTSEVSIPVIAIRTGRSPSHIRAINRRFRVREYQGRRITWSTRSR
jgi:hypothetical protein